MFSPEAMVTAMRVRKANLVLDFHVFPHSPTEDIGAEGEDCKRRRWLMLMVTRGLWRRGSLGDESRFVPSPARVVSGFGQAGIIIDWS